MEQLSQFREDLDQAQTRSIDAFLERRQEYISLGKAAMAMQIRAFEAKQALFRQRNHWYQFLLDAIDAPFEEIALNELSIVTYNYDRSLEAYLVACIEH
ncbi:MAG: hypothetical protein IPK99_08545 [Flavobacteriales bacterium]|nr:hypothetical protein [Flavobacteriales bacterium]